MTLSFPCSYRHDCPIHRYSRSRAWGRPSNLHAPWCPKRFGAPGECVCHRSATARHLIKLRNRVRELEEAA